MALIQFISCLQSLRTTAVIFSAVDMGILRDTEHYLDSRWSKESRCCCCYESKGVPLPDFPWQY